jgi:MFS family permease
LGLVAAAGFVAALVAQLMLAPHADRGRHRLVIGGAVVTMALSSLVYVVMPTLTPCPSRPTSMSRPIACCTTNGP